MSNRKIWGVRQRHVWLQTPLKGKRVKKRARLRIGLQEAIDRKGGGETEGDSAQAESEAQA